MRPQEGSEVQLLFHDPETFEVPSDSCSYWQPVQIVSKLPYITSTFSPGQQCDEPAPMLMFDSGAPRFDLLLHV